jgi:hypothetical protein
MNVNLFAAAPKVENASSVRREPPFVISRRLRGKFRELRSAALHGIKGVKSELFAIRASFADDTQSCRKLGTRCPVIEVTRIDHLRSSPCYRDSHEFFWLRGTFHDRTEVDPGAIQAQADTAF